MKYLIAIFFMTTFAHAGVREVGNGGVGVLLNEKPYLLDLYEAGILDPSVGKSITPLPEYDKRVQQMAILDPAEKRLLGQKLTELGHISPLIANGVVLGLNMFMWRLVDHNLVEIPERSPIDLTPLKVVQLANRFGATIRINKDLWSQMDSGNKVALVLHELFYAFAEPIALGDGTNEQESAPVRELIGYIFSPEFATRGIPGFENFTATPRRISRILSDSTIEYIGPRFYASSKEFSGEINMFTPDQDRWVFCTNLKAFLRSSGKDTTTGTVSYSTLVAKVTFEDYFSPTGMQKKLTLLDSGIAVWRKIQVGTFTFSKNTVNTCDIWVEKKIQEIRALPALPR